MRFIVFVFYRSRATVCLKQNDNYEKKNKKRQLKFMKKKYGNFSNEKENGNAPIVCLGEKKMEMAYRFR